MAKQQEAKDRSAQLYEKAKKYLEDNHLLRSLRFEEAKTAAGTAPAGQRAHEAQGLVVLSDEQMNDESDGDGAERVSLEKPGNA